jgi:hypothetical protein
MTSGIKWPTRFGPAFTTLPIESCIEILPFINLTFTPASGSIATPLVITRDPDTSASSIASFLTRSTYATSITAESSQSVSSPTIIDSSSTNAISHANHSSMSTAALASISKAPAIVGMVILLGAFCL